MYKDWKQVSDSKMLYSCFYVQIIITKSFSTFCSTFSLPIQDTIRLHFQSRLTDRGFHHVSLLVQEAARRNNPPLRRRTASVSGSLS